MASSLPKLTDHKYLIFDVYGTLADWETGLYTALLPLLSRFRASRNWSRKDALLAFMSVEADIQAQNPTMLYSDLLAKVHEVLEARLTAESDKASPDPSMTTLEGSPHRASPLSEPSTSGLHASADGESADPHTRFGHSIKHWEIFPDSSQALHELSKHFKLIVLSNTDHRSFAYTHMYLSEGIQPSSTIPISERLKFYTRPCPNPHPHNLWLPGEANPDSRSPFSLILTAQDVHAYKPALDGFRAALKAIRTEPSLRPSEGSEELTDEQLKSQVLVVAQSLMHDHIPANDLGIKSVWIDRKESLWRPEELQQKQLWTWRFETLGEMSKAVERELAEA